MSDRHQAQAYPLRLPDALKSSVYESAKNNGRSINAEVVARLQASFDSTGSPGDVRHLETALASMDDQNRMLYALLRSATEELGDTPLGRACRRIISVGDEMDRRFEDDDLSGAMELFLSHYAKIKTGEES